MKNKIEIYLDEMTSISREIRKRSEMLDGRNPHVKHIRTCIFALIDILNKIERIMEMVLDEGEQK